jgi:hypothetical protein
MKARGWNSNLTLKSSREPASTTEDGTSVTTESDSYPGRRRRNQLY